MDSNLSIRKRAGNILKSFNKSSNGEKPLDELKVHTLRVMLYTMAAASAAAGAFLIYSGAVFYSYISQLVVVIVCLFLLYRISKGCPPARIAFFAIIWYGFIMVPIVWSQLSLNHPMLSLLLCFNSIMIVLLFDEKMRLYLLASIAAMSLGMFVYDAIHAYGVAREIGRDFIGRGIGIAIPLIMLIYIVINFKEKYNEFGRSLFRNSMTDSLTGAYNTRMMDKVLSEYKSIYLDEGLDFSLALIDMDKFKFINDTYGHDTGDKLLILTAETITANLRQGDVFARYGGDEFVILLPGCKSDEAREIIERLLDSMKSISLPDMEIRVTFSAGVADISECMATDSDLFKLTDVRMYNAKDLGRNMVCSESVS